MPPLRMWLAPALAGVAIAAAPGMAGAGDVSSSQRLDENPCLTERVRFLNCPDLIMAPPFGIYAQRVGRRVRLRAGNSIDNVGRGPAELHGRRIGPRFMRARQRIYRRAGGRIGVETGARMEFKYAHLGRRWWKFHNAARFELWRLDGDGRRVRLERDGPKVSYCLRDYMHTRPRMRRSPPRAVYPACDTYPARQRETIGTSVGWSDVYPPTYPEQWIDVTGLRGCFAYVHIADPGNGIYESNERNNSSRVIVRLPWRGPGRRGCRGGGAAPGPGGSDPYGY
ncbi:MAG TPA: lysyl oxidase family protein [Thermoleophilaceae bacterium]|nr:lysyl oxidase family protein [Thermoleophilaceae bacterium]